MLEQYIRFIISLAINFFFSYTDLRSFVMCLKSQKYAMQQAFKTMMGQMDTQNNQFANAGFSPGSPFPFPPPPGSPPGSPFPFPTPTSQDSTATSAPASQRTVTVDVPPTRTEATPAPAEFKDAFESPKEPKKSGI